MSKEKYTYRQIFYVLWNTYVASPGSVHHPGRFHYLNEFFRSRQYYEIERNGVSSNKVVATGDTLEKAYRTALSTLFGGPLPDSTYCGPQYRQPGKDWTDLWKEARNSLDEKELKHRTIGFESYERQTGSCPCGCYKMDWKKWRSDTPIPWITYIPG